MQNSHNATDSGLLSKYTSDLYAMYVDYPHKSFWKPADGDSSYRQALIDLLDGKKAVPLLLYVHIPFCPRICYFCSCHTRATNNYEHVQNYLAYLHQEVDLLASFLKDNNLTPDFREIHLGGGSPTMLTPEDFDALLAKLGTIADLGNLSELAMEIDPRHVSLEQLLKYRDKGVNRISFGVQDFNPDVQQAVGRIQPPDLLRQLLTPEVRATFPSINFDIMWGLPRQTRVSFRQTIETVLDFSPDRISLLLLHYAPDVKKNQLLMRTEEFPDHTERTILFLDAVQMLTGNGYVRIGFDHFAKPADAVSQALREKRLTWNSLGYTPGRYQDIIGVGTGSSSRITEKQNFQNSYDQTEYAASLAAGRFPLFRSYTLTTDDVIRRDLLHTLRSYFRLDFAEIEARHGIDFKKYFGPELSRLQMFINDGLVILDNAGMSITEQGTLFTTLICRIFDMYSPDGEILRKDSRPSK